MTEPVRPLEALIDQAERDAKAHRDEAAKALMHDNEQSARLHGTLAQVHHWFAVEMKKVAALPAAPPAPTAEQVELCKVCGTTLAVIRKCSYCGNEAAPPERVSEGKA